MFVSPIYLLNLLSEIEKEIASLLKIIQLIFLSTKNALKNEMILVVSLMWCAFLSDKEMSRIEKLITS